MPAARARRSNSTRALPKSPTGIPGLDEITGGGLPKGRTTLVTGGAGCGKTLLSMELLIRGATKFDEPGLFVSFEENEQELQGKRRLAGVRPGRSCPTPTPFDRFRESRTERD